MTKSKISHSPQPRRQSRRPVKKRRVVKHEEQQQQQDETMTVIRPLQTVSSSSIHRSWKQPLGGLMRWYVHTRNNNNSINQASSCSAKQAEAEVEQMYFRSNCCVETTRDAILRALADMATAADSTTTTNSNNSRGLTRSIYNNTNEKPWIQVSMVMDKSQMSTEQQDQLQQQQQNNYVNSCDNQGILLRTVDRPGEGPAHAGETWKTALVPDWAVGQSYYFQITNNTPVPLSCVMTVDGQRVARNAPVPAYATYTLKPDQGRYFQSHQWRLQTAPRVPLHQVVVQQQPAVKQETQQQDDDDDDNNDNSYRYNEKRPDHRQQDVRVSPNDYPDPTQLGGWKFTGSGQQVEYFEKRLNMGVVYLDWEFATGCVQTVLEHPQTGRHMLMARRAVTPAEYQQVLQNPRMQRDVVVKTEEPMDVVATAAATTAGEDDDDAMQDEEPATTGEEEETAAATTKPTIYYAKNEAYNFQTAGHTNRQQAMQALEPTRAFRVWEQSTRQDWACVHAQFYVSMPRLKSGHWRVSAGGKKNRQRQKLPDMTPIVDTKAAEKAVLGTRFCATGVPAAPKRASRVRMERIQGLKDDDPEWRTSPVLEYKLYYRAEQPHSVLPQDDEEEKEEDPASLEAQTMQEADNDDDPLLLAHQLRDYIALGDYKAEKLLQLSSWHSEIQSFHPEEAVLAFEECRTKIQNACDNQTVDEYLKEYMDWHQKQQWDKRK